MSKKKKNIAKYLTVSNCTTINIMENKPRTRNQNFVISTNQTLQYCFSFFVKTVIGLNHLENTVLRATSDGSFITDLATHQ